MVSERKIRRLVERAKKYDPEAFSELYELYIKKNIFLELIKTYKFQI